MPRQRIGIIYVHGIGEQRRFEHLDAQLRPLIDAIRRRRGRPRMTAEIVGAATSALRADQDSWTAQPDAPVRIFVDDGTGGTEIFCHEVWWADVNEPYSLMKEMRFWFWGLSVWALPRKLRSRLPGAVAVMRTPEFPGGLSRGARLLARLQLLGVSNVFLMGALSIGAATFLAKRLFDFSAPDFVRVFVNYVSTVKLYNQTRRSDGGFLDAYDEPPRVSIRRRMIRTLADVALQRYDRWYVFAHSLGSVVAHNGLMESAHALPNYLDEQRWSELVNAGLAGAARPYPAPPADPPRPPDVVGAVGDMTPARPLWLDDRDVVYRERLFGTFRGLLTYGSPLDKFATIWPARVPINEEEPAFQPGTEWINVYDPTDPVGASLDAYAATPLSGGLVHIAPDNYGYRAHWALLYSHLCYLRVNKKRTNELSDHLVTWLVGGQAFSSFVDKAAAPWFPPSSPAERRRTWAARLMWLLVYLVLTLVGMFSAPFIWRVIAELAVKAFVTLQAVWVTIAQVGQIILSWF